MGPTWEAWPWGILRWNLLLSVFRMVLISLSLYGVRVHDELAADGQGFFPAEADVDGGFGRGDNNAPDVGGSDAEYVFGRDGGERVLLFEVDLDCRQGVSFLKGAPACLSQSRAGPARSDVQVL